ncbi:MAG: hypothetical protein HOI53_02260 [Francisellaceae bacterium]|jgi:hypothetical protein|nr:hypothetical protein [Francisellaceae bacterium]MBT6206826.1 hypothetical protein [Francisellaceae bacterium]MBT6538379.1 hypothetical protein [Francisellaceae bacterium]
MAAAIEEEFTPSLAIKKKVEAEKLVHLDEEIILDPTTVNPELLWRLEDVIEYFLNLENIVPLYGNFVPQYPRRPTSGRKLTPKDFGVKDDSSGGEGGGTAKGLRGAEQAKDKAINQFKKTGKYK